MAGHSKAVLRAGDEKERPLNPAAGSLMGLQEPPWGSREVVCLLSAQLVRSLHSSKEILKEHLIHEIRGKVGWVSQRH